MCVYALYAYCTRVVKNERKKTNDDNKRTRQKSVFEYHYGSYSNLSPPEWAGFIPSPPPRFVDDARDAALPAAFAPCARRRP